MFSPLDRSAYLIGVDDWFAEPAYGGVQQRIEIHRCALPGLERLAISTQDSPERDMLGYHVVRQKTRLACDREHQVEVIGLPRVHDVNDAVGM